MKDRGRRDLGLIGGAVLRCHRRPALDSGSFAKRGRAFFSEMIEKVNTLFDGDADLPGVFGPAI